MARQHREEAITENDARVPLPRELRVDRVTDLLPELGGFFWVFNGQIDKKLLGHHAFLSMDPFLWLIIDKPMLSAWHALIHCGNISLHFLTLFMREVVAMLRTEFYVLLLSFSLSLGCTAIRSSDLSNEGDEQQTSSGMYEGNATNFDGVAPAGGGCGTTPEIINAESAGRFVALNVQHTPRDYTTMLDRPVQDASKIGAWNNGKNCGRWIKVTIGDNCTGLNDGARGQDFCRNGNGYQPDASNGAEQFFLVVDSCQDPNAWCRDDRYHVDLSAAGIRTFQRAGQTVNIANWTNRKVKWSYVRAPNYQGDLRMGFIQGNFLRGAGGAWVSIIIANLPNGISRVEAKGSTGSYQNLRMVGDNGQKWEGFPATSNKTWDVRVYDFDGQLVSKDNKSVYRITFPCADKCGPLFTEVVPVKL